MTKLYIAVIVQDSDYQEVPVYAEDIYQATESVEQEYGSAAVESVRSFGNEKGEVPNV